jgi:hypothetical protein
MLTRDMITPMPSQEPSDQTEKDKLEQRLKEHRLQNRFHQAVALARERLRKGEADQAPQLPPKVGTQI